MNPFFSFDDDEFFGDLLLMGAASGGKSVEATATGNPLTFLTDLAKPLKSLLIPFTPIQQGTGDPSPSNIRPIVPWDGVTVWHYPENQLVITRSESQSNNGITFTPIKGTNNKTVAVHVKGQKTTANTFYNLNYIVSPFVPGTYKVYGETANCRYRVFIINAQGNEQSVYTPGEPTFTIPADAQGWWMRIRVDTDNEVDETIYPIVVKENESVTETDISFPSPTYGGTLDVVTGELWATYSFVEKKWNEGIVPTVLGDYTRKQYNMGRKTTTAQASKATERFCNIAPWLVQYSDQSTHYYFYQTSEGEQCIAFVFLPTDTDPTTTVQLAVALKNPVLVATLTPQQITALVGENTIWSDADGQMTTVYFKKG